MGLQDPPVTVSEQLLNAKLGIVQLLAGKTQQPDTLLEELKRLVKSQLTRIDFGNDFFQASKGILEVGNFVAHFATSHGTMPSATRSWKLAPGTKSRVLRNS